MDLLLPLQPFLQLAYHKPANRTTISLILIIVVGFLLIVSRPLRLRPAACPRNPVSQGKLNLIKEKKSSVT